MEPDSNGIAERDVSGIETGSGGLEIVTAIDAPRNNEPPRKLAGFTLVNPIDAQFERHSAEPGESSERSEPATEPNGTDFTPSDGNGGNTSGTKRRGRPPGSKNGIRTATQTVSPNLENLETLLFSVHVMGAAFLSHPKFALDHEETRRLGSAIRDVAKHYSFGLDPKKMAIANLAACAAGIYGPRVIDMWSSRPPKEVNVTPTRPEKVQPIRETPKPNGAAPVPVTNPSQLWDGPPLNSANDM